MDYRALLLHPIDYPHYSEIAPWGSSFVNYLWYSSMQQKCAGVRSTKCSNNRPLVTNWSPTGHQLVTHWSPTGHPLVFNVVRQMPLALIKALLRSTNTSAPQTLFV